MSEHDRLEKQANEMFVGSVLRDIGFTEHEIKLVKEILKKENMPLKSLLRQALRKWHGNDAGLDKGELIP